MLLQQHISCVSFRCRVCHSTLLPGSYTQGSDAGSLICTHHTTDSESTHPDLNWQVASAENQPQCPFQAVFSLGGLAISSVPHYSKTTESLDRLVCKTADMEGKERQGMSTEVRDGESRDCTVGVKRVVKKPAPPPPLPQPDVTHRAFEEAGPAPVQADSHVQQQEVTKIQHPSELFSPCAQVTEGSRRPVPAPRRKLSSSHVPAPAPRTKTSQTANSSPAAGRWTLNNFTVIYLLISRCVCVCVHDRVFSFMTERKKTIFVVRSLSLRRQLIQPTRMFTQVMSHVSVQKENLEGAPVFSLE